VSTHAALVVLRAARVDWKSCDAFLARAAVESPRMRVLLDGEEVHGGAILARRQHHIREAGGTILKWAAIRNFSDARLLVELGVPLVVKVSITDWRRRISARFALWNLVVDVEVLSATGFLSTSAAMLGEHCHSVGITLVITISEVVLIGRSALLMSSDLHRVDTQHFRPRTKEIDLWTDGCAMLVVLFTGIIDASLRSTLCEELLLGVVVEEHINVAFNLFGGRPIDLAIFLQALLFLHKILVLHPAVCLTLVVLEIASVSLALISLAQATFKLLLSGVTLHVHGQECVIR
jgi:hypothetical protein